VEGELDRCGCWLLLELAGRTKEGGGARVGCWLLAVAAMAGGGGCWELGHAWGRWGAAVRDEED